MSMALLPEMAGASATAASAFCASNLDDILLLLLLFSGTESRIPRWHVVAGQYLGFSLLVLASLVGFVGGQLLPQAWIGICGLFPIGLGVSQFLDSLNTSDSSCIKRPGSAVASLTESSRLWMRQLGLPCSQMVAVAGLTLANGSDNLGLYMPLFAHTNPVQLTTTLVVFFMLVGVWCLVAWSLVRTPGIADLISRYGQNLVPLILIGIGLLILMESHTFSSRPLAVVVLSVLMAMAWSVLRQLQQLSETLTPPNAG